MPSYDDIPFARGNLPGAQPLFPSLFPSAARPLSAPPGKSLQQWADEDPAAFDDWADQEGWGYEEDDGDSIPAWLGTQLMGGLEWVGHTLDKPGKGVRGLLSGRPGDLLHWLPFSDTLGITEADDMVSGRDMLETWGLLGANEEGLDAGDILGFGAEVVTDPFFWTGIGTLKPAGQAIASGAKAAAARGAAKHIADELPEVIGGTMGSFFAKQAQRGAKFGEDDALLAILKEQDETAKILADQVQATEKLAPSWAERIAKDEQSLFSLGPGLNPIGPLIGKPLVPKPWMYAEDLIGKDTAQKIAGYGDVLVDALKYAPGIRHAASWFDPSVMRQTDETNQRIAREAYERARSRRLTIDELTVPEVERYGQVLEQMKRGEPLPEADVPGVQPTEAKAADKPEFVDDPDILTQRAGWSVEEELSRLSSLPPEEEYEQLTKLYDELEARYASDEQGLAFPREEADRSGYYVSTTEKEAALARVHAAQRIEQAQRFVEEMKSAPGSREMDELSVSHSRMEEDLLERQAKELEDLRTSEAGRLGDIDDKWLDEYSELDEDYERIGDLINDRMATLEDILYSAPDVKPWDVPAKPRFAPEGQDPDILYQTMGPEGAARLQAMAAERGRGVPDWESPLSMRRHIERLIGHDYGHEVMQAIPEGSRIIGAGTEALAIQVPDGDVFRIAVDPVWPRTVDEDVLAPLSVEKFGDLDLERLPFVEHVPPDKVDEVIADLKRSTHGRGLRSIDMHEGNIGMLGGKPVILDPTSVIPEGDYVDFRRAQQRRFDELAGRDPDARTPWTEPEDLDESNVLFQSGGDISDDVLENRLQRIPPKALRETLPPARTLDEDTPESFLSIITEGSSPLQVFPARGEGWAKETIESLVRSGDIEPAELEVIPLAERPVVYVTGLQSKSPYHEPGSVFWVSPEGDIIPAKADFAGIPSWPKVPEGSVPYGITKPGMRKATLAKYRKAPRNLRDYEHSPVLHHGTGSVYDQPDLAKDSGKNLYGPGYYMSENPDIASLYTHKAADKLRNIEDSITGLQNRIAEHKALENLEKELSAEVEDWARTEYKNQLHLLPEKWTVFNLGEPGVIPAMIANKYADTTEQAIAIKEYLEAYEAAMSSRFTPSYAAAAHKVQLLRPNGVLETNIDLLNNEFTAAWSAAKRWRDTALRLGHLDAELPNLKSRLSDLKAQKDAFAPNVRLQKANIKNPFDVDAVYGLDVASKILGVRPGSIDDLFPGGMTGQEIYDLLESPRGLRYASRTEDYRDPEYLEEALKWEDAYDDLPGKTVANKRLEEAGFDGIVHRGGQVTGGEPHTVWVSFDPENQMRPWWEKIPHPDDPNVLFQSGGQELDPKKVFEILSQAGWSQERLGKSSLEEAVEGVKDLVLDQALQEPIERAFPSPKVFRDASGEVIDTSAGGLVPQTADEIMDAAREKVGSVIDQYGLPEWLEDELTASAVERSVSNYIGILGEGALAKPKQLKTAGEMTIDELEESFMEYLADDAGFQLEMQMANPESDVGGMVASFRNKARSPQDEEEFLRDVIAIMRGKESPEFWPDQAEVLAEASRRGTSRKAIKEAELEWQAAKKAAADEELASRYGYVGEPEAIATSPSPELPARTDPIFSKNPDALTGIDFARLDADDALAKQYIDEWIGRGSAVEEPIRPARDPGDLSETWRSVVGLPAEDLDPSAVFGTPRTQGPQNVKDIWASVTRPWDPRAKPRQSGDLTGPLGEVAAGRSEAPLARAKKRKPVKGGLEVSLKEKSRTSNLAGLSEWARSILGKGYKRPGPDKLKSLAILAKSGNKEARDELAKSIVGMIYKRGEANAGLADVEAQAQWAMAEVFRRFDEAFDPNKAKFSTFAKKIIDYAMRDEAEKSGRILGMKAPTVVDETGNRLSILDTVAEAAEEDVIDVEEVLKSSLSHLPKEHQELARAWAFSGKDDWVDAGKALGMNAEEAHDRSRDIVPILYNALQEPQHYGPSPQTVAPQQVAPTPAPKTAPKTKASAPPKEASAPQTAPAQKASAASAPAALPNSMVWQELADLGYTDEQIKLMTQAEQLTILMREGDWDAKNAKVFKKSPAAQTAAEAASPPPRPKDPVVPESVSIPEWVDKELDKTFPNVPKADSADVKVIEAAVAVGFGKRWGISQDQWWKNTFQGGQYHATPPPGLTAMIDALAQGSGHSREELARFYNWVWRADKSAPVPKEFSEIAEMIQKAKGAKLPPEHVMSPEAVGNKVRLTEGTVVSDAKTVITAGDLLDDKLFQMAGEAPPFYSKLREVVDQKVSGPMPKEQLLKTLQKNGVKPEEIEYTNLDELYSLNPKPSKEELSAWVDDNQVKVEEVRYGEPTGFDPDTPVERVLSVRTSNILSKNDIDTLGAAADLSEDDLFYLAENVGLPQSEASRVARVMREEIAERTRAVEVPTKWDKYSGEETLVEPGAQDYRELVLTVPGRAQGYTDSHFEGVKDNLAHIRFDTRTAPDGKKVLFIEEIQSDLHQAGRSGGYQPSGVRQKIRDIDKELDRIYAANHQTITESVRKEFGELDFNEEAQIVSFIMSSMRSGGIISPRRLSNMSARIAEFLGKEAGDGIRVKLWEIEDALGSIVGEVGDVLKKTNTRYAELNAEGDLLRKSLIEGAPDAPFKKTWQALTMKRMIRWAAENDFDRIAWTTGETQSRRYNKLLEGVKDVVWNSETGELFADSGGNLRMVGKFSKEELPDAVGSDAASNLLRQVKSPEELAKLKKDHGIIKDAVFSGGGKAAEDLDLDGMLPSGWSFKRVNGDLFELLSPDGEIAHKGFVTSARDKGEFVEAALSIEYNNAVQPRLSGQDLKISDKFFKFLYDTKMVNDTNQMVKKWGAKVYQAGGILEDIKQYKRPHYSGRNTSPVIPAQQRGIPVSLDDVVKEMHDGALSASIHVDPVIHGEGLRRVAALYVYNPDMSAAQLSVELGSGVLGGLPKHVKDDVAAAFVSRYKRVTGGFSLEPQVAHAFDITPAMKDEVLNKGQALFQRGKTPTRHPPRAAIHFQEVVEDGDRLIKSTIHGFEKGDLTSMAHEFLHHAHRDLLRQAESNIPEAIADLKIVSEVYGVKKGATWQEWTVDQKEAFAKDWERYLKRGKAPTKELEPVFARLKIAFTEIYKKIKDYFRGLGAYDERMDQVFDGWITGKKHEGIPDLAKTLDELKAQKRAEYGKYSPYEGVTSGRPKEAQGFVGEEQPLRTSTGEPVADLEARRLHNLQSKYDKAAQAEPEKYAAYKQALREQAEKSGEDVQGLDEFVDEMVGPEKFAEETATLRSAPDLSPPAKGKGKGKGKGKKPPAAQQPPVEPPGAPPAEPPSAKPPLPPPRDHERILKSALRKSVEGVPLSEYEKKAIVPAQATFDELVGMLRTRRDFETQELIELGLLAQPLRDLTEWAHRSNPHTKLSSKKKRPFLDFIFKNRKGEIADVQESSGKVTKDPKRWRVAKTKSATDIQRMESWVGFKEGTEGVNVLVRRHAGDKQSPQMLQDIRNSLDKDWMQKNLENLATDEQFEAHVEQVSQQLSQLKPELKTSPDDFFDRTVIDDLRTAYILNNEKMAGAQAIHKIFAQNGGDAGTEFLTALKEAGLKGAADDRNHSKILSRILKDNKDILAQKGITTTEQLKKLKVDPDTIKAAKAIIEPLQQPGEMKALLKQFDRATDLTKKALTLPFPAFHMRNLLAGMWSNYVSDAFDLKSYQQSLKLWKGGRLTDEEINLLREIETYRVADPGYGTRGIGQSLTDKGVPVDITETLSSAPPTRGGGGSILSDIFGGKAYQRNRDAIEAIIREGEGDPESAMRRLTIPVQAAGQSAGEAVEWMNRVSHYLAKRKKGWSPAKAAESAKYAQHDYGNLTQIERSVAQRLVPFYSFAKANLPWTLNQLIKAPGGAVAQTIRSAKVAREDSTIPEWMPGIAFPVGPSGDDSFRFVSGLGIPVEEAFERFQVGPGGARRTAESHLAMVNPLLKLPLELLSNRQFFSGRELQDLYPATGDVVADEVLFNSPASRFISTARTIADERKGPAAKALNLLTGVKVSDVDLARAKKSALRKELLRRLESSPNIYMHQVPLKSKDSELTPEEAELLGLWKAKPWAS